MIVSQECRGGAWSILTEIAASSPGWISGLLAQFNKHPDPYPPIGFCPITDHAPSRCVGIVLAIWTGGALGNLDISIERHCGLVFRKATKVCAAWVRSPCCRQSRGFGCLRSRPGRVLGDLAHLGRQVR